MGTPITRSVATRMCVFCGKPMPAGLTRCPACREEVPQVHLTSATGAVRKGGGPQMRRGFLYMLFAGVIQFFAGGYSGMTLPVVVSPLITTYLAPLVFIAGLGLLLYGLILRARS